MPLAAVTLSEPLSVLWSPGSYVRLRTPRFPPTPVTQLPRRPDQLTDCCLNISQLPLSSPEARDQHLRKSPHGSLTEPEACHVSPITSIRPLLRITVDGASSFPIRLLRVLPPPSGRDHLIYFFDQLPSPCSKEVRYAGFSQVIGTRW